MFDAERAETSYELLRAQIRISSRSSDVSSSRRGRRFRDGIDSFGELTDGRRENMSRSARRTPSVAATRASTRVARSECPPSSKKSSSTPSLRNSDQLGPYRRQASLRLRNRRIANVSSVRRAKSPTRWNAPVRLDPRRWAETSGRRRRVEAGASRSRTS